MADQGLQSAWKRFLSRDHRERATESASCARSAQRARVGSTLASTGFRGSELVSKSRSMRLALQTASAPSSAWRKRDLRNGPSHGGNTSGSRAEETFSTTSTG